MRVLVTGASGFLGFHLCGRLLSLGHDTTGFHRKGSRTGRLGSLGVRCVQGELADITGLRQAVAGHDVVIHAAADIKSWPERPELQTQANVEGSRNVALACRLESVRRMIHVSSVSAIGMPADALHPADEDFRFNLSGPGFHYHISKKRAEEAVLEQVAAGLDAVIVNPGTIFGPYGSVYRGAEFIRKVLRAGIIPCFTGGRCAVHAGDVVDGILAAIHKGVRGNRYILGGENVSYREMAARSARALHLRRRLVAIPSWSVGPLMSVARLVGGFRKRMPRFASHYCDNCFQYYSSDKARRDLAYAPRGFDEIVRECLAWSPS